MCGRFVIKTDLAHIQQVFDIDKVNTEVRPSYNVTPTQPVVTVVQRDGERWLEPMRWGLIPVWAKDESLGSRMINARAESVAEKNSFKRPLKSQRCLIVADGFYEWNKFGTRKTPLFIRLKSNEPFAFAGLYDVWRPKDRESIVSCAIITTTPNELMGRIHDRMPVILPKRAYADWLDPSHQDVQELTSLLKPYLARELEVYEVSRLVNSPKNNAPELIQPVGR
jgi:putative SOS response-associated peptidase YedK